MQGQPIIDLSICRSVDVPATACAAALTRAVNVLNHPRSTTHSEKRKKKNTIAAGRSMVCREHEAWAGLVIVLHPRSDASEALPLRLVRGAALHRLKLPWRQRVLDDAVPGSSDHSCMKPGFSLYASASNSPGARGSHDRAAPKIEDLTTERHPTCKP